MNPPAATTAIFGAAVGYRPAEMRVLLQSLSRVGFKGMIVLLVGDLPTEDMDTLHAWGATPIVITTFPGRYPRACPTGGQARRGMGWRAIRKEA